MKQCLHMNMLITGAVWTHLEGKCPWTQFTWYRQARSSQQHRIQLFKNEV